jgi:DNA-binding NtrC family response regulator
VRELQNTLKRAALLAAEGTIEPAHLGLKDAAAAEPGAGGGVDQEIGQLLDALQKGQIVPLERIEQIFIRQALHVTDGNITEAANRLGVSRSTVYRKLEEYGLEKP